MDEFNLRTKHAFVDESGDLSLNTSKDGVSSYYVVAAIVVDEADREELYEHADRIRKEFFGDGEIKSSRLGSSKYSKRLTLLEALEHPNLKFYAFVINKTLLHKDSGLKFKKSAFKHLHGRLYSKLYQTFSSLRVFADEHGREQFMDSFKQYLNGKVKQDLFEDDPSFTFVPSHENTLVQVADLIAGTIRRIYSGEEEDRGAFDALKKSALIIEPWPPSYSNNNSLVTSNVAENFDYLVAKQSVSLARNFISENENSANEETSYQVETIRYLLSRHAQNPAEYIYADAILRYVNEGKSESINSQYFRTNVIARLRSKGVIIASSNKGYKIPCTAQDIEDFVSLVNGHAMPYIKRLSQARHHLLLSSAGKYDIVTLERYPQLYKCLEAFKEEPQEVVN